MSGKPGNRRWLTIAWIAAAVGLAGGLAGEAARQAWYVSRWAEPTPKPGLPNLHRVSSDLYRGGQPSAEGLAELKRMGVRTVIDLAGFPGERERAAAAGLDYVAIPVRNYLVPAPVLAEFLRTVSDRSRGPFFVHCAQGTNRTGVAVAAYRIVVGGWPRRQAIAEMTRGDFGFEGDAGQVADYINSLDLQSIVPRGGN